MNVSSLIRFDYSKWQRITPASITSVKIEPGYFVKIYTPAVDYGQWPVPASDPMCVVNHISIFMVYEDRDPGDED